MTQSPWIADPNLECLMITWGDVRKLDPEAGDRLLMIDAEAGEMVAVFTGKDWVAAHDRALVVHPTYVFPIPCCTWLPVLDHGEYRAAIERMIADPPNVRRRAASLKQAAEVLAASKAYRTAD